MKPCSLWVKNWLDLASLIVCWFHLSARFLIQAVDSMCCCITLVAFSLSPRIFNFCIPILNLQILDFFSSLLKLGQLWSFLYLLFWIYLFQLTSSLYLLTPYLSLQFFFMSAPPIFEIVFQNIHCHEFKSSFILFQLLIYQIFLIFRRQKKIKI